MHNNITVYTPDYRQRTGFILTWKIMFNNIIKSRELIWVLFKRDFFTTYKKSFLGFSWVLISPIIGIVSWVFLNSAGILKPGDVGIPFPAFVLLSSSIWGLFMGFYGSAAGTLGAGSSFIMQVNYPHEVLLVKQVAQQLANFSISFAINIVVLLLFKVVPDWKILLLPLLSLPMFFLGAGLGLMISVISVVASDISNFVGIILGFVFYITPVIYAKNTLSEPFKTLVTINPLTYLVGGVRDIILSGHMDFPDRFIIISVLSLLFFLFAWRFFYISENKVIERML